MSRLCALAAWLCATLGSSMLVCGIVLVPNSFALADEGAPCGTCTYEWIGTMWFPTGNTCTSQCVCPTNPGFPPGPGEPRTVDCSGVAADCVNNGPTTCVFDGVGCSVLTNGKKCNMTMACYCTTKSNGCKCVM